MSGFDLPPVTGYDKLFEKRLLGAEGGLQGPLEGPAARALRPGGDLEGGGVPESQSAFTDALSRSLGEMRSLQDDVKAKYEGLIRGEDVELHDIMAAANKSEVMFNLMLEVRNKLVEAWEKLSRSSV